LIVFSNVVKQYGRQVLFTDLSFQINPGEKAGLVRPNGCGKTTLFRLIKGVEQPDEGSVSVPGKLSIAYFRQELDDMSGWSVLDEAIAGSGELGELHHEIEKLQHEMSNPENEDSMERILDRYGEVQHRYESLGGYGLEAQAREVLHGLGFEDDQVDADVGILSVGWKMRVSMAQVLLGKPDILLMDEPKPIIWISSPSCGLNSSYGGPFLAGRHGPNAWAPFC
jgi:ATPase subunit of ABC transporter with duplicated ATPase domains